MVAPNVSSKKNLQSFSSSFPPKDSANECSEEFLSFSDPSHFKDESLSSEYSDLDDRTPTVEFVKKSPKVAPSVISDMTTAVSTCSLTSRASSVSLTNSEEVKEAREVREHVDEDSSVKSERSQPAVEDEGRDKFLVYWKNARKAFGLSDEGMMLNASASKTGYVDGDRSEIMKWLYSALENENGKTNGEKNSSPFLVDRLIEIGAGIGRMTFLLQAMCKEVIAVDFIEEYIKTNEERHYNPITRPNDKFLFRDATTLRYEEHYFDVVFWNWLLMYLGDDEVISFVTEAVKWLKIGGFLFCRESCGEPSTKQDRSWASEGNPTEYRPYAYYTWLLTEHLEKQGFKVEVVLKEAVVSIYRQSTGTEGQRCWLIKRVA